MDKEKKVIFSKEIDSSITGFALGISFVLLAGLIYYFDIFHWSIVDRIMSIFLLVFGIGGTCIEIGRIEGEKIKGIGDFLLGLVITILALFLILKFDQIILNVFCSIVLFFSLFGTIKGVIEVFYSLRLQRRKSQNKKIEILKVIAVITELLALAVAVFQFMSEIQKVQ